MKTRMHTLNCRQTLYPNVSDGDSPICSGDSLVFPAGSRLTILRQASHCGRSLIVAAAADGQPYFAWVFDDFIAQPTTPGTPPTGEEG